MGTWIGLLVEESPGVLVFDVNHDNLDLDRSMAGATKKAALFFSYHKRSL